MTASLARVPCTIVTGFLGAGKTTLIRHVLANAGGRRLAVIVNEFGDVGIDGEILKGCGDAAWPEENIVELANGCLCCTVADEFVPALDAILAKDGIEHIVIETSGLALPKPLVQAFHWPAIKNRVTVDSVVVVVDGAALADGRMAHDLDAFDSFVVPLGEIADPVNLAARVAALAAKFDVLRVKGFAAVANKPLRLLVQAVGSRVTHQYDRPWAAAEPRESRLVVIGLKGLDRAAVTRALAG